MSKRKNSRPISLALQGGGAHGAYTWGVLDRLCEDEGLDIRAISATSAGAVNAVAFAAGISENGREGARVRLEAVWKAVADAGAKASPFGPLSASAYALTSALQSFASPYDIAPLGTNQLRDVLDAAINFSAVKLSGVEIFLTATNVETGKANVFSGEDVTLDAVLASAALPQTFQALEYKGQIYWDGGYMGNPSLFPLTYANVPRDVLLVILNPLIREGTPRSAVDIQERINEISFNASLVGELRAIAFVQKLIDDGMLKQTAMKKYKRLNIHAIRGGDDLKDYPLRTKSDTSWSFLTELRDLGRAAAETWLQTCAHHVGTETSSVDLRKEFLDP